MTVFPPASLTVTVVENSAVAATLVGGGVVKASCAAAPTEMVTPVLVAEVRVPEIAVRV